jgi:O-antigen ligase
MYVVGAAASMLIILAIPSVGEGALARFTTLSQIQSEDTWNGRWGNWQGALDVIASRPILGAGAGNYAEAAMDYSASVQAQSARDAEVIGAAHNMVLGVGSQLGLVGLILFLGMLFFAFKTAVPIAQRSSLGTGFLLGLIVVMIAGMTLTWETHKMVYFLFGSVLALQLQYATRRAPSDSKHERPA